jgi:hypothetical protein
LKAASVDSLDVPDPALHRLGSARRRAALAAGLLAVVVVAVYLNALAGVFQFDDYNVIVFNPTVQSFPAWWADLAVGIRPLLKLTYTINWVLAPGSVTGFHAFNIGVHVVNTILVGILVVLLARGHGFEAPAPAAAMLAALLFALHPAQTEAVTYISGRSSSLMAMFYLGGVVAYMAGSLAGRHLLTTVVAPLLFLLALVTKEAAVTFPLALLLWEWSRPDPRGVAIARRLAPSGMMLIGAAALVLHPLYGERLVPDLSPAAVHANLLTQVDAVGHLVQRLVVVHPLNIDPDLRRIDAWTPSLAGRAALLLTLLALGFVALRRRPWWGFGILWFYLQLAPTNSLLPRLDLANDRQLYLASVGLVAALGVEWQRRARGPIVAAVVVFAALTMLRNLDYSSEVRLWEQTARVSPHKARVFNNLGVAYSSSGCLAEAEVAYLSALRLEPGYEPAGANLALLRERMKASPAQPCDRGVEIRPAGPSGR